MPAVRLDRLTFGWGGEEPILDAADLDLAPGWTALVGENGAGKTTLLRLVAGELPPRSGAVRLPRGARVLLCPQSVETRPPVVPAFAAAGDGAARALRGRLALDPAALARWPTLSPGERRRWQLGAALHADPDVLLLDEPTDHVDEAGRGLVAAALRAFRGVGVLVSHDRALLEALCGRTVRLHRGRLRALELPYGAARAAWEAEAAAALAAAGAAQAEARRAAAALDEARRTREATERARSGRHRDPKDRDDRTLAAKTRVARAEAGAGRAVAVRRRALEAARAAVPGVERGIDLGRSVFVGWERAPRPVLAALEAPALRAGGAVVLHDVAVRLGREDRAWLRGPNGAGKSTLLRALAAAAPAGSRLLVLEQELTAAAGAAALDEVRGLPPAERGRVLQLVAALGTDPARLLASGAPSPGEARKLVMALGLGRHAWGLLLDEPTNHLDLPTVERLEAALEAFPGALLLVTHDERLARRCTSVTWRLERGRVEVG